MRDNMQIKFAAFRLGIHYENAKVIMRVYKKDQRFENTRYGTPEGVQKTVDNNTVKSTTPE